MARFNTRRKTRRPLLNRLVTELVEKLGNDYTFSLVFNGHSQPCITVYKRRPEVRVFIIERYSEADMPDHIVIKDIDDNILERIEITNE